MNEQAALAHESLAACWTAKGKPEFAAAHMARAEAIRKGAAITDAEKAGDQVKVMAEMSDAWQPIETAPKNAAGAGTGPWILVWNGWNSSVIQVCWSFRPGSLGKLIGYWHSKLSNSELPTNAQIKHWMPMPAKPL